MRGGKFLGNIYPDQHIYSLWSSMESLICCTVMQSLSLRFISDSMCFHPCVQYSETFFIPIREEGTDTISLCVLDGFTEAFRTLHRSGYSI